MEYAKTFSIDVQNELEASGLLFRLDFPPTSWSKLNKNQIDRVYMSEQCASTIHLSYQLSVNIH